MFKTYNDLITFAKNRNWSRNSYTYLELHHILPKNMGGDDSPDNLVFLKVEEHIEAHYLLAIEHSWDKKIYYANLNAAYLIIYGKTAGKNIKETFINEWLNNKDNIEKLLKIKESMKGKTYPNRKKPEPKEHFWLAYECRYPSSVTKKSIFKYLQEGYILLKDCPICHKPNSNNSFACSLDHEIEYMRIKKEEFKAKRSEQSKEHWQNTEIRNKIIAANTGKSKASNNCWVTNGIEDIMISKDDLNDFLEKGYLQGRSNIQGYAQTEEYKQKLSERRKNSCYVKKDGIVKEIKLDELETYISDGWTRGTYGTSRKGIKQPAMAWVHNSSEIKRIRKENLQEYLDNGWVKGRK